MTVYEKYSKNVFFSVGLVALVAVAAIVILVLQSGIIPSVGKGSFGWGGVNGDPCVVDSDCSSNICGLDNNGIKTCSAPNVDLDGDWCRTSNECSSFSCVRGECYTFVDAPDCSSKSTDCDTGLCGFNNDGDLVCVEPHSDDGGPCRIGAAECIAGQVCAPLVAGEHISGWCIEPRELGAECFSDNACISHDCRCLREDGICIGRGFCAE